MSIDYVFTRIRVNNIRHKPLIVLHVVDKLPGMFGNRVDVVGSSVVEKPADVINTVIN